MKISDITELQKLLGCMYYLYGKLQTLENEKTQILTKGNANELITLMNSEQALLMECRSLEKHRMNICKKTEYETLRELVESSDECREYLGPIYIKLSDTVNAVKKTNSLNMKLLDTRLATMHFLLNRIGISEQNKTYNKRVQVKV